MSQVGKWCFADHDEQYHGVPVDGGAFVRFVADALVVREGDPSALSDGLEPGLIRGIRGEVVGVAFDDESGGPQDLRKATPEIAVGEENTTQATRS